jgi:hypothetical protein
MIEAIEKAGNILSMGLKKLRIQKIHCQELKLTG